MTDYEKGYSAAMFEALRIIAIHKVANADILNMPVKRRLFLFVNPMTIITPSVDFVLESIITDVSKLRP